MQAPTIKEKLLQNIIKDFVLQNIVHKSLKRVLKTFQIDLKKNNTEDAQAQHVLWNFGDIKTLHQQIILITGPHRIQKALFHPEQDYAIKESDGRFTPNQNTSSEFA